MNLRFCAFNTGTDTHLLDHIGPLSSFLGMPLIVTEEQNWQLAAKYYPELETHLWPDLEFRLEEVANEFSVWFECKCWDPQLKNILRFSFGKEVKLVFCPHGQSDKGYGAPVLGPYAYQERVLLYGELLREMLADLKVLDSVKRSAYIGNFRALYYEKHRTRLLQAADIEIFSKLSQKNQTLLYAPTWRDADEAGTFFEQGERLVNELPSHWNLIIKLHPLIEQREPALFCMLSDLGEKKKNCLLIHDFPLVYPILDRIDAYLGDYSSVGYDVLFFRKPMFFFQRPQLPPARLHSCGKILDPTKSLFQSIEEGMLEAKAFKGVQQALYERAFTAVDDIRGAVEKMLAARG